MNKIRFLLTTIAVLLCSVWTKAHDFEVDGIYYNITSETDLTVEVTYKGTSFSSAAYSGIVTVPKSVKYNEEIYSVSRIGNWAFYFCPALTEISIPNSVVYIGEEAFCACTSLTNITIPESVLSIGYDAFYECRKLPVEDYVIYAGNWAVGITNMEQSSYTLRTNTVGLADWLFYGNRCTNVLSVEIPNTVKYIGSNTFYGCSSLTSIIIPNSVTTIGSGLFAYCTNLTNFIMKGTTPISVSTMTNFNSSATLTVPNGSAKAYSDMGGFWGQFASIKEEANVNISEENMWSTCVLAFDAELPEGVRAFISMGMDENSVLLEEVTTLEAYKPYVLYAQNGYEGTLSGVVDLTAYQETVTDGVLSGAIVKQEASSGYILQNQGQGSKFYNMNGQTFTIPAGKCWLSAFDAGASSVTMRFTGGVTGIEGVYMERPTGVEGADMLYDLEGRRVENPLPGRVYIKGGKKVMLKNREFKRDTNI